MKLIERSLDFSLPWTLPQVCLFTSLSEVGDVYPGIDRIISVGRPVSWIQIPQGIGPAIAGQWLGWFQAADVGQIEAGFHDLNRAAQMRPEKTFKMNAPIPSEKLPWSAVLRQLQRLPDNCHIYKK